MKLTIIIVLILILILSKLRIANTYLQTPIKNRKQSIKKQFANLTAVINEKRNHPGLVVNSQI